MYKTFIDILELCTDWCNQNWLVLVAFIIVDLMIIGGFFLTIRGRIFRTQRTIEFYNETIKQSGLGSCEDFQRLDKTIRGNRSVITEAWAAAYPDNICFFVQSVSFSNTIGQMGRSHTRRNFIFGLAMLFAAFSTVIIIGLLSTVGYLAFALPIIVFVLAFLTEAIFIFIDDRNTKKLVREYNEFFMLVTNGTQDVYGVRVCQCQCVTQNFEMTKAKVAKAVIGVRQSEIKQTLKSDDKTLRKEKVQISKTAANKEKQKTNNIKQIKAKVNEQKNITAQNQKQTLKVKPEAVKEEIAKRQKPEQKNEIMEKQIVEKRAEKAAAPVKRQEQKILTVASKKDLAVKSNKSTKKVAKTESPKTTTPVVKMDFKNKVSDTNKTETISITPNQYDEKVKVSLYMADTQTASFSVDSGKAQTVDTNKTSNIKDTKKTHALAVTESTKEQLSTDERLQNLSQRLSAIREVTTTQTTETVAESKVITETKAISLAQSKTLVSGDDSVVAVKAERRVAKKEEKRGKYNESEVMNALDGLFKTMTATQEGEDELA